MATLKYVQTKHIVISYTKYLILCIHLPMCCLAANGQWTCEKNPFAMHVLF